MSVKITKAISYYVDRRKEILSSLNKRTDLSVNYVIKCGEELNSLESKISALEIAMNN